MKLHQVRIAGDGWDAIASTHRTFALAEASAANERARAERLGFARTVEIVESDVAIDESFAFCAPVRDEYGEHCVVGWGAIVDGAPCPRCGFPAGPVREVPEERVAFDWFGRAEAANVDAGAIPLVTINIGKAARS